MEKNGQVRVETNYLATILFFVVMSASLGLCNVFIKPGECMIVFFASHVIGHLALIHINVSGYWNSFIAEHIIIDLTTAKQN